jgi:hypothetical protein
VSNESGMRARYSQLTIDLPGRLIPGCEWHISPLGRSYFVNHNARTTSWKKPRPECPAGSLMPECIIHCGRWCYNDNLACLGTSGNIMSILYNGPVQQWTRAGRPVGNPFSDDEFVYRHSSSVSRWIDGRRRMHRQQSTIVEHRRGGKLHRSPMGVE